jgi:hypothetical protein
MGQAVGPSPSSFALLRPFSENDLSVAELQAVSSLPDSLALFFKNHF